jgi:hypothetical protein
VGRQSKSPVLSTVQYQSVKTWIPLLLIAVSEETKKVQYNGKGESRSFKTFASGSLHVPDRYVWTEPLYYIWKASRQRRLTFRSGKSILKPGRGITKLAGNSRSWTTEGLRPGNGADVAKTKWPRCDDISMRLAKLGSNLLSKFLGNSRLGCSTYQ